MTNKNLRLGYALIFLSNLMFWYAPWLLFLLQYIDLPQAAILQAVGLVTGVVAEVPTGALSDLIGKKKTLLLAFLFTGIGELITGFSSDYWTFVWLWMLLNIGYSFYSGTMEAFMYDTLAAKGEEKQYSKVVSHMQVALNAALAVGSLAGGFLFTIWHWSPFFLTGVAKIAAFILALSLVEPAVDTDTFSWRNFVSQTKQGFAHLFSAPMIKEVSFLLIFGSFMAIAYEFLDDIAIVDWGFDGIKIGFIYTAGTLLAVAGSPLYRPVARYIKPAGIVLIAGIFLALNYLFSPWITAGIWVSFLLLRSFFSPIRESAISELLNHKTKSAIRATTLSTYQLIRKIPYVILAASIGTSMEQIGIKWFSHDFALALIACGLAYGVILLLWQWRQKWVRAQA